MQHRYAIDHETLAYVLEDLGDDLLDVFDQLAELFLSDTPQLLESLKHAINRQDFEEGKRIAHRLKGGCAQMGASPLARDADLAEDFCRSPNPSQLERIIEKMEMDWGQLANELTILRDCARQGDRQAFLNLISDRGRSS